MPRIIHVSLSLDLSPKPQIRKTRSSTYPIAVDGLTITRGKRYKQVMPITKAMRDDNEWAI